MIKVTIEEQEILERGKYLVDKYGGVREICLNGTRDEILDYIKYLEVSDKIVIRMGGKPNPVNKIYIEKLKNCLKGKREWEITLPYRVKGKMVKKKITAKPLEAVRKKIIEEPTVAKTVTLLILLFLIGAILWVK